MDCNTAKKNINAFLKETLKGNELRKTYYHFKECKECREALLDEFSFYAILNDLDKDLDFNYEKNLSAFMDKVENDIKARDSYLVQKYIIISVLICIGLFALLITALMVVYR